VNEELVIKKAVSLKGKLIVSASLILDVPKSKCRFGNHGDHPLLINKTKNKTKTKDHFCLEPDVRYHIFVALTSKVI